MLKDKQITISAYEMEVIKRSFTSTLKWLEFYIEKSDYSGNWQRQIPEPIKREDLTRPSQIKGFMETALLALDTVVEDKPDFVLENLQEQFYSWLDKSGVRVENCPEELTESLVDVYKVLTNEGKEFAERTSKEAGENIAKMTPEERRQKFYQTFTLFQRTRETAEGRKRGLEGKTYKDVDMSNQFSGNSDRGKKIFSALQNTQQQGQNSRGSQQLIGSELAASYDDKILEFKIQESQAKLKGERDWDWGDSEQGLKKWLSQLETERIKRHVNEWRIERVKRFRGNSNQSEKWELALVYQWANLNAYNQWGYLEEYGKIYFEGSYQFEQLARPQVNQDLSQGGSSQQHYSRQLVIFGDKTTQPTKESKPKEATPIIIGVVCLTALLGGLIVYKVKNNKVRNKVSR